MTFVLMTLTAMVVLNAAVLALLKLGLRDSATASQMDSCQPC